MSSGSSSKIFDVDPEWVHDLLEESATFFSPPTDEPARPFYRTPPFDRNRPVSQRAFRSDGKRPKDGAGLGSPLIVEPGHLFWSDPLSPLRSELQAQISNTNLVQLMFRLSQLSDWKRVLEDDSSLENCPLGLPPDLSPELSLSAVKTELKRVQDLIQESTDRVIQTGLPSLQSKCRESGWRFQPNIKEGQPFRLDLLAELAELCSDNDSKFVRNVQQGLGLGVSPPLSDCLHFPIKEESVHAGIDFAAWASSYKSAEEMIDQVQKLLQEDLDLGVLEGGFSWSELCTRLRLPQSTPPPDPSLKTQQLIPGVAVTRVGCIDECSYSPSGELLDEKFRLVFDGTAAGVNDQVLLPVIAETPGLLDGESLLGFPVDPEDPFIGFKIDVKGAFKRIMLHKSEYPYSIFSIGGQWYFSKSCPMGMRASPYHWCRFNSIIHRITKRLGQNLLHGSLMYIDDSLYASQRSKFPEFMSLILVFLRLLGVPISWKKLEAGFFVDWVGYRLDFSSKTAYLSESRLQKLEAQMSELSLQNRISLKDLRTLTYRMQWASQSFVLSKIFLHAFFKLINSTELQQKGYVFSVSRLVPIFELWTSLIKLARTWRNHDISRSPPTRALTRTDAAAEPQGLFIGGWFSADPEAFRLGHVQWFAFQVSKDLFPVSKKANNHLISATEALGVAVALAFWGSPSLQSDSNVTVQGIQRWYSSSPNLALAFEFIVRASIHHGIRPRISWTSGVSNKLADRLSRIRTDPSAARHLRAWLPSGGRVDSEVLFQILPELRPHLVPLTL